MKWTLPRKRYLFVGFLAVCLLLVLGIHVFARPAPVASTTSTTGSTTSQTAGTSTLPNYTSASLAKYNGDNAALPIYIALDGNVYDVTPGKDYYAPGKIYHFLVGKDSSEILHAIGGDKIKAKYKIVGTYTP